MDKLGEIINKRLNQHKLGDTARASEIVYHANVSLHKRLNCTDDDVRVFRLKEGVLYVGTAGSAWSQEVFYQQEGLLEEMQKQHGPKSVLKIVIKGLTSS